MFDYNCPSCNQKLQAEDEWEGLQTQCPFCHTTIKISKTVQAPIEDFSSSPTFDFVCPECGTMAELPISFRGKPYECKACREASIAQPAPGKKCPYCGEMRKNQAKVCKFCKKNVTEPVKSAQSSNYPFAGNSTQQKTPTGCSSHGKKFLSVLIKVAIVVVVFGCGLRLYSNYQRAENHKIPFPPEMETTYPFSWKNTTMAKVEKWLKESYPGREIDVSNNDDGTISLTIYDDNASIFMNFVFDSMKHLRSIGYIIDKPEIRIKNGIVELVKSSSSYGNYVRKFDAKYGNKQVSKDSPKETFDFVWMDKTSHTRINLLGDKDNTILVLSHGKFKDNILP